MGKRFFNNPEWFYQNDMKDVYSNTLYDIKSGKNIDFGSITFKEEPRESNNEIEEENNKNPIFISGINVGFYYLVNKQNENEIKKFYLFELLKSREIMFFVDELENLNKRLYIYENAFDEGQKLRFNLLPSIINGEEPYCIDVNELEKELCYLYIAETYKEDYLYLSEELHLNTNIDLIGKTGDEKEHIYNDVNSKVYSNNIIFTTIKLILYVDEVEKEIQITLRDFIKLLRFRKEKGFKLDTVDYIVTAIS